jgi:transcriptional regulator with XRE-family HTH domain
MMSAWFLFWKGDDLTHLEFLEMSVKGRGLSRKQIAMLAGVHPSTVGRWFSGDRQISVDEIIKICTFINVNPKQVVNMMIDDKLRQREVAKQFNRMTAQ